MISNIAALKFWLLIDIDILAASFIDNEKNYHKHLFYYLQLNEDSS